MVKQGTDPKLCLVVDDSRVVRKVARRLLEDREFAVAEAADGMEGLAWCRAMMPDLVLLDASMPLMSGLEFLRRRVGCDRTGGTLDDARQKHVWNGSSRAD